jgi:YHS domain-containing protein
MANSIDPVCGMELRPGQVEAQSSYQGQQYDFCSQDCRRLFEENPAEYVQSSENPGDHSLPTTSN